MKWSQAIFGVWTLLMGVAIELRAEDNYTDGRGSLLLPPSISSNEVMEEELVSESEFILPSLEEELFLHGGSYLYEPSDVSNQIYAPGHGHSDNLRLPENWQEPQPLSLPDDFLGANFVQWNPHWKWFGRDGSQWEPRLVGYGSYELFGAIYEQNRQRRDGLGHQLIVDFDLALTGTERVHVQFRPLGRENSGGSFWQLNDPVGYQDNSTGVPQRWWFEGELQSIIGALTGDERLQLDINFTAGRFPFLLHNGLLMNDEIVGFVLGKNTITSTPLSNLNVQAFYAIDEVDSFPQQGDLYGLHLTGDYRHAFLEATVARVERDRMTNFESNYFAGSATQFFGPLSLAGRVMFKTGSSVAGGSAQLYVMESSYTRIPNDWCLHHTGVEKTVTFLNVFHATEGWTPISGGGFNRLRNNFVVNPLLNLAAAATGAPTQGVALGSQLFRHHADESWTPEVSWQEQSADGALGLGLRYQKKLTARTYFELRGIKTWSDAAALRREGLFASTFIIF